jgi:DNA recombination protein RmuC
LPGFLFWNNKWFRIKNVELILLVLVLALSAFSLALFWRFSKTKESNKADPALLLLQNQINELTRMLDTKLGETVKATQWQFSESMKVVKDITERLARLDETNKQVINFADQLKHLQDILKNPKQRGVLGEYYLKTVLENVLPPGTYEMQHEFKDGTTVDAVVITKDGLIPIDSKFSLENYNRILEAQSATEREKYETAFYNDLKMRVDEASKYIKPSEKTLEFAFMFIPSEAIYYDLLINKVGAIKANTENLIEYAYRQKKVIVVSPTTFLAYLQTVLQGLRAMQIEESAKEIRARVEELGRHLASYDTYMQKLGAHLGTTVGMYTKAYKELEKVGKDIRKITGKEMSIEPMAIEGPDMDDSE